MNAKSLSALISAMMVGTTSPAAIACGCVIVPGSSPAPHADTPRPSPYVTPSILMRQNLDTSGHVILPTGSQPAPAAPPAPIARMAPPVVLPAFATQPIRQAQRFQSLPTGTLPQANLSNFVNVGVPTDKTSCRLSSPLRPVAFSPLVVPRLPNVVIDSTDSDSYSIRHDGNAKLSPASDSSLDITSGGVVIIAHKAISVNAGDTTVNLNPSAIAYISVKADSLLVRALHDKHMHDVSVTVGNQSIPLSVGSEICIGADQTGVASHCRDGLARKNVSNGKLSNGAFARTSRVHLPTLIVNHPLLVSMHRRQGSDRAAIERILKMAVCLHFASDRNSEYKALD